MTLGSGGSLGTVVLVLAWVLAAIMAVAFVAAVLAFWYARRDPDRSGSGGNDLRPASSPESSFDEAGTQAAERTAGPRDDAGASLAHDDPLLRVDAIAALRGRPDAEALLLEALGDEYPLVRREAVRGLGSIGTARATHALIEVAGHDLSAEVREEAVAALGALLRERQGGESST